MARGPPIDGAVFFLGHMRRHTQATQFLYESGRVVVLVGAQRRTGFLDAAPDHDERSAAFGCARCQCRGGVDHQAVAVLHQRVAKVEQSGLVAVAFFVQPRIGIGRRLVCLFGVFLALEVSRSVASAVAWRRPAEQAFALGAEG